MGLQAGGKPPGRQLFFILPIVQAFAVGQRHIHIGRVGKDFAAHKAPFFHGMYGAAKDPLLLPGLIQTHEQQRQEGHIVTQTQSGKLGAPGANLPADAAVDPSVAGTLGLSQFLRICRDIAKHIPAPLSLQHNCQI